jgi:transposase
MKLYGGIDLHSNNSVVAITDERDEVLYRKRLPNDLSTILSVLEPYREALDGLVVESTYNWYWLVDGLMDAGYRMHLANTAAIKQYEGLKYSDDDTDACWLAKLLRLGLLPEGYIYPKAQRPIRDLLRKRSQLVRQHTANLLSVQNLMARNRGASISANAVKRLDFDQVGRLLENEPLVLAAAGTLVVMRSQQEMIALVEKVARRHVKHSPAYGAFKRLCTVNGIGEVPGLTILLETGDIGRFERVGNYVSYCRCVDSKRISNGKKKGKGNRKNGNKYLAWAFVEAANFAVRFEPRIRRYYQRKRARSNAIVAIKTVAHKLARACYFILRDGKSFDVERAFG